MTSTGIRGDAEKLDEQPGSRNILVSLKTRNFLVNAGLAFSQTQFWQWIAHAQGLDVTALLFRGEVVGAAIGFYSSNEHAYLTHVTAAHRDLRAGVGVGLFLRKQQLRLLMQRVDSTRGPLEVVSLSANPNADSRGAVSFQRNVLEKLGFQELQDALPIIQRIAQANPGLELDRMLQQDVSPLRCRQVATASGSE